MGKDTKISWTHHTFNPWIGCTKVSPGCKNCYAEALMDLRHGRVKWGDVRVKTGKSNWSEPVKWNKQAQRDGERRRVFCASLADVFDEQVPIEWLKELLQLIDDTQYLDWMLLTKRPENIISRMSAAMLGGFEISKTFAKHMPNIWLGVSAENQRYYDERLPIIKALNPTVTFVSAEPLLGPIKMNLAPDLLIVGGESGQNARISPNIGDWYRDLRDQAAFLNAKGEWIAFQFKQWGGTGKDKGGDELDGKRWHEQPEWKVAKTKLPLTPFPSLKKLKE